MIEKIKEKLKTEDKTKQLIANHVIKQCELEPSFIDKVLKENKSLNECIEYIMFEAKKLAEKGMAMVDNDTVFGWTIHYFDEENLDFKKTSGSMTNTASNPIKSNKKPSKAKPKEDEDYDDELEEDIEDQEDDEIEIPTKVQATKTKPITKTKAEVKAEEDDLEKYKKLEKAAEGQISLFDL